MIETIKNAWKIEDLRKKMLFTVLVVFLYRLGASIPAPFINPEILKSMIEQSGSLFGYLNVLTGGAFANSTLFALTISPYITSSIVIQLLTIGIPYLEELSKEGEAGRKKLGVITRYTTVILALIQAAAYYVTLNRSGALIYSDGPEGIFAAAVIVMTFTGGSMLLVWMGEQVDEKGIGNGISLIIFAGIVSRAPHLVTSFWSYIRLAMIGMTRYYFIVPLIIVMFAVVIGFIVLMTEAERRIPVQYAQKVVGRKMYGGQSSHIPIKVNMSGVLPVIFSSSFLAIPSTIMNFANLNPEGGLYKFLSIFNYDHWFYAVMYFILIMLFNYFYVSVQYNPVEIANNLRQNSGTIPGIRPGKPTSDFISRVVGKITFIGGLFIALIAVMPIFVGAITKMNISLGGTTVIIVVGVALDTVRALESMMTMRHYKGFLE